MTTIPAPAAERNRLIRSGVNIELLTIIWTVIEAVVAISAGVLARSVLLTAFGIDSVIELVTGGVLLWRLLTEARARSLALIERAENRAAWVAGLGLALLCIYVVVTSLAELLIRNKPEQSLIGVGLSLVALVIMPFLAWRKRTIAARIGSAALRGDAACSITCAYMSATLLAGLVLNAAFGWWWADGVAALLLLRWLVPEAREALTNARAGRASCSCGRDDGQEV